TATIILSPATRTDFTSRTFVAVVNERLKLLGVPLDGQDDLPFLDTVGGLRDRRKDLPAVREAVAHRERAVPARLDRFTLDRDASARRRPAKDDHFGVDVEEELPVLGLVRRRRVGQRRSVQRAAETLLEELAEGSRIAGRRLEPARHRV